MVILKWLVFLPLLQFQCGTCSRKNVCKNFHDYSMLSDTNRNCFYNPDVFLDSQRLIQKYAGYHEKYEIVTDDGYILSMYRIPKRNPKKVILLHHPITADSSTFVFQGPDSLAFYLWRSGYEIWLSNQRGTPSSLQHINMTSFQYAYWDFTFHEMAQYEVTKELELIRSKTNNAKVTYIGHSMGTTVGLIYSSMYPDEAHEWIETFVLVCPPFFFQHSTTPMVLIAPYEKLIMGLAEKYQIGNVFFVGQDAFQWLTGTLLRVFPELVEAVHILLNVIYGWTPEETDPFMVNVNFFNIGRDFSWKALCHFFQLMNVKTRFQMFDYGPERNKRKYGSEIPPVYPLERNRVPIVMMYAEHDSIVDKLDVEILYGKLDKNTTNGRIIEKLNGLNHVDVYFGKHRFENLNQKLLSILNSL